MTAPTKEQLAPNIEPMLRDYIDACISEAIQAATLVRKQQAHGIAATVQTVIGRLAEMEQFERQVRSHLGIYVPE